MEWRASAPRNKRSRRSSLHVSGLSFIKFMSSKEHTRVGSGKKVKMYLVNSSAFLEESAELEGEMEIQSTVGG